jgi:hypothetical protein
MPWDEEDYWRQAQPLIDLFFIFTTSEFILAPFFLFSPFIAEQITNVKKKTERSCLIHS